MMRELVLFFLLTGFISVSAQEKLMPLEQDSAQIELERKILYQQLLSGTLETGGKMENLEFPKFDFNTSTVQQYNFQNTDYVQGFTYFNNLNSGPGNFLSSPFLRNGTIFSAATYRLSDKFTFGGYSFGANSIFSAPYPNQSMNKFDTRGSTMFMQYKVTKNIKIETRVSVSQGREPGF